MARRFVAGETRVDAVATVRTLAGDGLRATVAFLGEHVSDADEARTATEEIERLLRDLAAEGLEPNCSLKLTQLGLLIDDALAEHCLRRVLAAAGEAGGFVRIDMEGSEVLPATLSIFERVREHASGGQRVGVVIQSYLRRSEDDVRALIAAGAAVRLVKGAYAEPPEVAYTRKTDVDDAYVRLASLLLSAEAQTAGVYPAFATHDPAMIAAVRRVARERAIAADRYEFQMLLGVRRDLQIRLAEQGQRVRVYVPYGGQWYPYFMRRLAERPANLFFLMRNLIRR
ncbi:MAG: proline dehydrogenase family protein [Chloroflexi bacterium]|nr:proline dehydrogenase family protein [Chloroflexota bacterium]